MKRLFALLMVIAMLFCVSACGNKPSTKTDNIDNQTTEVNKSDDITTDDSYESIDPESWGITDRCATDNGDSEIYYINFPQFAGTTHGYCLMADQGDDTAALISGQNDEAPEISDISELFPAYFDQLQYALEKRYGMRASNFELTLTGNAPARVGDYDMHTFTGTISFDYKDEPREYSFVAYATTLKSNGAYAYWLAYDKSDDQSNGDLIKEHALNMAKTFREEE